MKKVFSVSKAKMIGGGISIVGLALAIYFTRQVTFSNRPENWFNQEYWVQFMPLVISVLLLIAGLLAVFERPNANFNLAVFGHTISEDIIFGWLGLTNISSSFFNWLGLKAINLPDYSVLCFFGLSLICLCIAYSNILNLKRVSLGEALFAVITGIVVSFLPSFL